MPTWLRSLAGLASGGLNMFANGTSGKQILVSLGLAGLGIVSHLTSTSDSSSPTGKTQQTSTVTNRH
jgi:hypothetical protein